MKTDFEIPDLNWKMFRPVAHDLNGVRYNFFVDSWENTVIVSRRDRIQTGYKKYGEYRYKKITCVYGYQKDSFKRFFKREFNTDLLTLSFIMSGNSTKDGIKNHGAKKDRPIRWKFGKHVKSTERKQVQNRSSDGYYIKNHRKNPRLKNKSYKMFNEKEADFGKRKKRS